MDIEKGLKQARQLLTKENLSFVALDNQGRIFRSEKRGVAPGLELISMHTDLSGGVIADKVVGKAAALLFLLLGAEAIFASTVSQPAKEVLSSAGVRLEYQRIVDHIVNRAGDGPCPLEHSVQDTEDPEEALTIVHRTLAELMGAANG